MAVVNFDDLSRARSIPTFCHFRLLLRGKADTDKNTHATAESDRYQNILSAPSTSCVKNQLLQKHRKSCL